MKYVYASDHKAQGEPFATAVAVSALDPFPVYA